jgi:hypothetical protein
MIGLNPLSMIRLPLPRRKKMFSRVKQEMMQSITGADEEGAYDEDNTILVLSDIAEEGIAREHTEKGFSSMCLLSINLN